MFSWKKKINRKKTLLQLGNFTEFAGLLLLANFIFLYFYYRNLNLNLSLVSVLFVVLFIFDYILSLNIFRQAIFRFLLICFYTAIIVYCLINFAYYEVFGTFLSINLGQAAQVDGADAHGHLGEAQVGVGEPDHLSGLEVPEGAVQGDGRLGQGEGQGAEVAPRQVIGQGGVGHAGVLGRGRQGLAVLDLDVALVLRDRVRRAPVVRAVGVVDVDHVGRLRPGASGELLQAAAVGVGDLGLCGQGVVSTRQDDLELEHFNSYPSRIQLENASNLPPW